MVGFEKKTFREPSTKSTKAWIDPVLSMTMLICSPLQVEQVRRFYNLHGFVNEKSRIERDLWVPYPTQDD